MSVKPIAKKSSLFLVHRETGQRYPLRDNVIIGRERGDIVFIRDMKLSSPHCQIRVREDETLEAQDLRSANGTLVNGNLIAHSHPCPIEPGDELEVGEQAFSIQSVSLTDRFRFKRKRSRKKIASESINWTPVGIVLFALVAIFLITRKVNVRPPSVLHATLSELRQIFTAYDNLHSTLEHKLASPDQVTQRIQSQVITRLVAVADNLKKNKFSLSPTDRQILALEQRYTDAFLGLSRAKVQYIESGDTKYFYEMDQSEDQMLQIGAEFRGMTDPTALSMAPGFPAQMQSPFQIVEKEMRRALVDYRKMGEAVRSGQLTDKQMAQAIHSEMLPKLNAVTSRMGVIKPQGEVERRKLDLDVKLVAAFTGQLKAMALLADTRDPKYAKELEQWTVEVENLNAQYKQQGHLQRRPATR